MDLLILILGIALLGFLAWIITTYIPMQPIFKTIIYVVVAVSLVFFVLRRFSGTVPNVLN